MSVLTDRTQGGSSLREGEIELMVHRRLNRDGSGGPFMVNEGGVDGKGLVIRGKHYLYLQPISQSAQKIKSKAESLFVAPIISFDKYSSIKDYSYQKDISFSALTRPLPDNVHLLTLENWKPNQVLLRLEHFYESDDNIALSKPVEVNLNDIFRTFKVTDAVEMTLSAIEPLASSKRLQWNSHFYSQQSNRTKRAVDLKVKLNPQQIRTFILTVEANTHKEGMSRSDVWL